MHTRSKQPDVQAQADLAAAWAAWKHRHRGFPQQWWGVLGNPAVHLSAVHVNWEDHPLDSHMIDAEFRHNAGRQPVACGCASREMTMQDWHRLAPRHFRAGWGGFWHQLVCRAECPEMVAVRHACNPPTDPVVPPTGRSSYDR